ncbi:MAG: magnesium transporter [Pirellulaceae bacterium]
MLNTLYLPELREMLDQGRTAELREFCNILHHPLRAAEFMEGLDAHEAWQVLKHADSAQRLGIFGYFHREKQLAILEHENREEIAELIAGLAHDDRVDLLQEIRPEATSELLPLLPEAERRDILRLQMFPEGTAGSVMTSDAAMLAEHLTVSEAFKELSEQAEELETIYYLYVVDEKQHLRGVVSTRQLVSAMGRTDTKLADLMETDIVLVNAFDDQEVVAQKVARYDLLAIPVVDSDRHMLGIITHDDVMDVVREEATEDAHRIAAVDPLEESYLKIRLLTLSWKRGIWLTILFVAAILTALILQNYETALADHAWLVAFIPLVISSGGNTGSQSATLVITAMAVGDVKLNDYVRVISRELAMGLFLGGFLGSIGFLVAFVMVQSVRMAVIIPVTLVLVVVCGALAGSILPLVFKRLGLDPALMSNPFVAGIVDILGIVIYMNVALTFLA